MLLCTISISPSTQWLASVVVSVIDKVYSPKLIAFRPPVASYFSSFTIHSQTSGDSHCERLLSHTPRPVKWWWRSTSPLPISLYRSLLPSPRSHRHHRLLYARLSSGCGHSDGDRCSWSHRVGDTPPAPKVISVLASTCWPGPLARPPQVRGQRVMEGTVTQEGRKRKRAECWSEKQTFYQILLQHSQQALFPLCSSSRAGFKLLEWCDLFQAINLFWVVHCII